VKPKRPQVRWSNNTQDNITENNITEDAVTKKSTNNLCSLTQKEWDLTVYNNYKQKGQKFELLNLFKLHLTKHRISQQR